MKYARTLTVLLASAALATTAYAASETKVSQKVEINGKAADVWAKIGAFCAIKDWHPAVAKCDESKEGDATFRTLTLKDGAVIKEKLTGTKDNSYSYSIVESPLPVIGYNAVFSVVADDDDEDEVNVVWTATFMPKGKEADAKAVIEGVFKGGLDNIQAMMK